MEINIENYLSNSEIQSICEDEVRSLVRSHLKDETELKRVLSNTAYETVCKLCDDCLDGDMKTFLYDKIQEQLSTLSLFNIFKKPDAWDRESNNMYNFLQSELEKQKPVISEIVAENVQEAVIAELKVNMQELVIEAVQNIYRGV